MVPVFTLGDRMRKARTAAGISQWHIAHAFGVDKRTVSRWEHDQVVPSPATVFMWAHVCGVELDWLDAHHPLVATYEGTGLRFDLRPHHCN